MTPDQHQELSKDINQAIASFLLKTHDWPTLPELMEELTQSWNKNPAVVGRGLFRLNGTEAFSAYAARMKGQMFTYPQVAETLDVLGYPSRIGVRFNKEVGHIGPLVWGPRK